MSLLNSQPISLRERLERTVREAKATRVKADAVPPEQAETIARVTALYGAPIAIWQGGYQGKTMWITASAVTGEHCLWF